MNLKRTLFVVSVIFILMSILILVPAVIAIAQVETQYIGNAFFAKKGELQEAQKNLYSTRFNQTRKPSLTTPLRGIVQSGGPIVYNNQKNYTKLVVSQSKFVTRIDSAATLPSPGELLCCNPDQLKYLGMIDKRQCTSEKMTTVTFNRACKGVRGVYTQPPLCQVNEITCMILGAKSSVSEVALLKNQIPSKNVNLVRGIANATKEKPYGSHYSATALNPLSKATNVITGGPTYYNIPISKYEKTRLEDYGSIKNAGLPSSDVPAVGEKVCCNPHQLSFHNVLVKKQCQSDLLTKFSFNSACKGLRGIYTQPPNCQASEILCTVPKKFVNE